jgi:hypothetical protein
VQSDGVHEHPTFNKCCYFGIVSGAADINVRLMREAGFIDSLVGSATMNAAEAGERWLSLVSHGTSTGSIDLEVRFVPIESTESDTITLRELQVFVAAAVASAAEPEAALQLKPPFAENILEYSLFVDAHTEAVRVRALPATHCFSDPSTRTRKCEMPLVSLEAGQLEDGGERAGPGVLVGDASEWRAVPLVLGRNTLHLQLYSQAKGKGPNPSGTYVLHVHR